MKIKNLVSIAGVALATLVAPLAAKAAGSGNIYEIRPVDENGVAIASPTEPLGAGSTVRFVVRLAAPTLAGNMPGNPFRLVHVPGLNSEAVDWATGRRPAIGIFVNGKMTLAYLEKAPTLRSENLSDFVFSYTVKAGDFALPIRLANSDMTMVTDQSEEIRYYLDLGTGGSGVAAWRIEDSVEGGASAENQANFQYGNTGYPLSPVESDGRRTDYDLTGCNFNIRTIDFDKPTDDERYTPGFWRTVSQGEAGYKDANAPRLVLTGAPTNSVKLYLWSENEEAFYLANGVARSIHVTHNTTESRRVLEIDTVADYNAEIGGYEFQLAGAENGKTKSGNLVLSAFADFNYYSGSLTPDRIGDYLFVPVLCGEPSSAKVSIKPGRSVITAKHDYTIYETELNVSFNKPYTEDVVVEIVPSFTDADWASKTNWWEYIRLSAVGDDDPTLNVPTANPKVLIPAGSKVPTQFVDGTSIDAGKIYVYALRSDAHVTGAQKMTFAVKTDNENAKKPAADGGIDGWGSLQSSLTINGQEPAIVSMFDGTDTATAVADSPRTLKIVVSDVYADMVSDEGYEIWLVQNTDSSTETTFTQVPGLYKPGKGGVLYSTNDTLPTVTYKEPGLLHSTVYVKAPVSGNQSANYNFTVNVTIPKGYIVETSDGVTEFDEGTSLQLKITLDEQNMYGDMFAYLVPESPAASNAVSCSWLAQDGKAGILMKQYDQVLASGCALTMIDGDGSALGSTFVYSVVFCSEPKWDPNKKVNAYRAKNVLRLTTHNIMPSVGIEKGTYVQMNGNSKQRATKDGDAISTLFPMNFDQKFTVKVYEPGTADKTAASSNEAFRVRWFFEDEDGSVYGPKEAPASATDPGIIVGDPDKTSCTFDFPTSGRWAVTVELKDKDMDDFGNGEIGEFFTFYVDIVDQPTLTVETNGLYLETESADNGGEASIKLNLELNSCNFPLTVNLKIEPNDPSSVAPGVFQLITNDVCVLQTDGSYNVTVPKKVTSVPLFIKTLDGTRDSYRTGFKITPTMISTDIVPNSGNKKASEYYLGVAESPVKVMNVEPQLDPELDVYPVPGTNVFKTAIGKVDEAITWTFNDVTLDFQRPKEGSLNGGAGIKVEFKGGGGFGPKWYTSLKDALDAGSTGFKPEFTQSGSIQTVKLIITDPDNGVTTVSWQYEVEAAKSMSLVAHGPSMGNGAALGKRYRSAAGIGEGRVWAASKSTISVSDWVSVINCGLEKDWRVYGYGYKVGDIDGGTDKVLHYPDGKTGYYSARDTEINSKGNTFAKADTAYAYKAPKDDNGNEQDSFLYAWLQIIRGESGSDTTDAYLNSATTPEYADANDSGAPVGLPTEMDEDGSYQRMNLEAIFSLEYLASDNMGDINQDGIPDIYVDKYGFGVVDTVTGTINGNDLEKKHAFNDDEDYFPVSSSSKYPALIPTLAPSEEFLSVGNPFTARLEIRGYHDALNDAPMNNSLTKISGVKPDKVYTNPKEDSKSTLSYVEWLAWTEFAAANGLDVEDTKDFDKWSPERPTDPTVADTDEDGIPDGYEYYFWYRAHVGYLENEGTDKEVHKYLTGRRYDARNPGEGILITSEEIARLMDPVVAGDKAMAETQDSDNDGLPDLVEVKIGTNPFDFDTDGDGLPDGWEVLNGFDPTRAGSSDRDRISNEDGDAMAISSFAIEGTIKPVPLNREHAKRWTLAVIKDDGDSAGVQWYATTEKPEVEVAETVAAGQWWKVTVGDKDYCVVSNTEPSATTDGRLARVVAVYTLVKVEIPAENEGEDPTVELIRGYPTTLPAGAKVVMTEGDADVNVYKVKAVSEKSSNACWIYGKGGANALNGEVAESAAEYGCLALARQLAIDDGRIVCAMVSDKRDVAFLHYLCYQEFGFDPRTAWCAKDPMHKRWGKSIGLESVEGVITLAQGGYTGHPVRTRDYTAYDEFLVYSFFVNNGVSMERKDVSSDWDRYTTNPNGMSVKEISTEESETETEVVGSNGADTDGDGVADGWELYVMAGPKTAKGEYVFAPPYDGFAPALSAGVSMDKSHFSPFVASAQKNDTSNQIFLGGQENDDTLNEFREFGGTDVINYYSKYSNTIVRDPADEKWLNKFFPTDPWNADTDGDGVNDNREGDHEGSKFVYGSPADDGSLWSIPGGGLNPCSVDTDRDGLPDGWELQFAGSTASMYAGEDADYAKVDGAAVGNPLQGLTDGMDGTVWDASTLPNNAWANKLGFKQVVNRDYDHDGLENWQEYLTGTMRCWRYDDPVSPLTYIPDHYYYTTDDDGNVVFDEEYAATTLMEEGLLDSDNVEDAIGEFWYKTLVDATSTIYNPHLVTGTASGAQYFSKVTNAWDVAYWDDTLSRGKYPSGAYYWFYDRVNDKMLKDTWGAAWENLVVATGADVSAFENFACIPTRYASCSPIDADSDHDGMDDYYEVFHGMNPLLGEIGNKVVWVTVGDRGGVAESSVGIDLVYDSLFKAGRSVPCAWGEGDEIGSFKNYWQRMVESDTWTGKQPRGTGYDFEVFPWLNGLATADADGDGTRNQEESIMGLVAPMTAWHHSDPTPLWMTDSSYSNSLTRMFYRLPTRANEIDLTSMVDDEFGGKVPGFVYNDGENEQKFYFSDFPGFCVESGMAPRYYFGKYQPDCWSVVGDGTEMNFVASFEENEGFDTDHDGINDRDEVAGKFRGKSDPIDADSPRRRQAMYFQGADRPSILQTMPTVKENHPLLGQTYPDDMSFLHYTVELWVKADTLDDATIIERTSWVGESNPGDQEFVRCNFQLGVKGGKWYTKYDPNDTTKGCVEALSDIPATTDWTHIAATYNGETLYLYVNGERHGQQTSGAQPAYGASAAWVGSTVNLDSDPVAGVTQTYWRDSEYQLNAIVIGASVKTCAEGAANGYALDVTRGAGWDAYTKFFKGYVDEVRIWDGARSVGEIKGDMNTRYTSEMAAANRTAFYNEWSKGGVSDIYRGRYAKDENGNAYEMPAELRYHWSFDSVFGAATETLVAKAPNGFDFGGTADSTARAKLSRPEGYEIAWWKTILDGYTDTVYNHPAWVEWIPNTVAHLPRFDGTTLDSFFWSDDFKGEQGGTYKFAHAAEPVSNWTQFKRNALSGLANEYTTTSTRHYLANEMDKRNSTNFAKLYEFTARHLNQVGDDLLPLGGAFVKQSEDMWDNQGASSNWEINSGSADSADGIPAWWANYANDMYYSGDDEITWNTIVKWPDQNGVEMTAGEAYMRDIANGYTSNESGDYAVTDGSMGNFAQTYDMDGNGLPDWWEELYGLVGADPYADTDNDGLPNYVEYLLSEVFDFAGVSFSPVNPRSVDPYTPDYFFKVGDLYVGEIFTDHDLVDDLWEDLYDDSYSTRLLFDAYADSDNDGWSNRSEVRYSKMSMPIQANGQTHYSSADGLVADYPIPTIALTVKYNEARKEEVAKSTIIVKMTTDEKLSGDFDATFVVEGSGADAQAGSGTSSNKDDEKTATALTRTIGKWSNRHIVGTLTPGYINKDSVSLQFCHDPSQLIYSWIVWPYGKAVDYKAWFDKRGLRIDYDEDRRKYGEANVELVSRDTQYRELHNVELRKAEDSSVATWVINTTGLEFGTLDLTSGAFDLDLSAFAGQYVVEATNANDYVSLEDQTYRIAYAVNPAVDLPRKIYLGEANVGHVREGLNKIIAFADLDNDGEYTPGEPFGCVAGVDVSWRGTSVEVELTGTSVVCPRMNIATGVSDREVEWGTDSGYWTNMVAGVLNGGNKTRVRVIRTIYNTDMVSVLTQIGIPLATANKVVLDKYIDLNSWPVITEADFIGTSSYDIDWNALYSEILSPAGTKLKDLVTFYYRVVLGEGSIELNGTQNLYTVLFPRSFDTKTGRTIPTLISPSATAEQQIVSASPTFKWSMNGYNSYTAFRIQVNTASGALVYDSGFQRAIQSADCTYEWTPPMLKVGDKMPNGTVFANNTRYTWRVSMYNTKFMTDAYSATGTFFMNVPTDKAYGVANVSVKYFGPKLSYTGKTIRVKAYTSPDFTGNPVGSGYVAKPDDSNNGVAVTGKAPVANATIVGIPAGTYYLQAFIDSNNNGVCDKWESMGYLCDRTGATSEWLNPVGIKFGDKIGAGDLAVIYIEDADTDGDSLPDAWEYAKNGNLTAAGVETAAVTPAGGVLYNKTLATLKKKAGANTTSSGLAGQILYTLTASKTVAALTMGVDPDMITFNANGDALVNPSVDNLKIVGLAFNREAGLVDLKVSAEAVTANDAITSEIYTVKIGDTVTVKVLHTDTLAGEWSEVATGTVKVDATATDISVKVDGELPTSGFFKAVVK